MRVVVCTIVHHPADARIYHRQIRALLDAGHQVMYIAPVDSGNFYPERSWPSVRRAIVLLSRSQAVTGSPPRQTRRGRRP